jgi:hypothetical protein
VLRLLVVVPLALLAQGPGRMCLRPACWLMLCMQHSGCHGPPVAVLASRAGSLLLELLLLLLLLLPLLPWGLKAQATSQHWLLHLQLLLVQTVRPPQPPRLR